MRRLTAVRTIGAPRANMIVIGTVYGIYALSLLFQARRWSATPAYRNLLVIMPQSGWGTAFAVLAALLAAAARWYGTRWLSVLALTAALVVTTAWGGAFVVRWLTSSNTTPETWVSFGVLDYMILRALALLDFEEVRIPRGRRRG